MPTVSCIHCGQKIDVVADMTICPNCQQEFGPNVIATIQSGQKSPDIVSSVDTAKTAMSGTAQHPINDPLADDEELSIAGSSRTIQSAGQSPNLMDFSATLKPTDSAFESVDLASAIPPRALSTTETPGEAQDYRLGEKIGSGSFGVVYRAEQLPLERTVALKMLKPRKQPKDMESDGTKARIKSQRVKDRNEFLREAQFTGKLEHPNIVPVHDIGLVKSKNGTGNRPFYVMKEIKGDSWQSKLKHQSRTENLAILRRVADAIEFSHDKNILHCDLKPENVMLGEFGEVLVVDWGGAVDLSRPETYRPGGSPAYISPEMARYWCDVHLDNKAVSSATQEMGKQSDVYLLGAMLFEIVTGHPPHFGLKGETAYDVMRRATQNQIRKHEKWMDDELMQIARRALRLDESITYETVHQFQDALRDYETRRISIELRERANELLSVAKETNDYDAYGKARFGFEESIEKWEENKQSQHGLRDARLSCAALALKDQNFDLGIGMLENPETAEETTLRKKLVDGRRRRDSRKTLVRILSIGMILGGIGSLFLMVQAWNARTDANQAIADAVVATDLAVQEKAKAEVATSLATTAKADQEKAEAAAAAAERLKLAALEDKKQLDKDNQKLQTDLDKADAAFASKTREFQDKLTLQEKEVDRQAGLAEKQKTIASEQQALAEVATRKAEDARERNRLLRYKDNIAQIRSSLDAGDFASAKKRLAGSPDDAKSSWEWARLNMTSHPEAIEFLPEPNPVFSASASEDGSRIVLIKQDSVSVHETNDFEKNVGKISVAGATAATLSPDGKSLAIAVPGQGTWGRIEIHNATDNSRIVLNEAPSQNISDLKFSPDGQRLLCVGVPNRRRMSTGNEQPLMVYERVNDQWIREIESSDAQAGPQERPNTVQVNLAIGGDDAVRRGTSPKFTHAIFSQNGNRILVYNSNSSSSDRDVHVYVDRGAGFRWLAATNTSGIDAATFANDSGTEIVGCYTEPNTASSSMFVWNIPEPIESAAQPSLSLESPVSISTTPGENQLEPFARLSGRVRSLKRNGQLLLTGGDDKTVSLWNLTSRELIKRVAGHSREVDFCTLVPGSTAEKSVLISIATGANPEILRTDLGKYQNEIDQILVGDEKRNSSPASLFRPQDSDRIAFGSDNGEAAVRIDDDTVEWEVSAWRNHVVTDEYLFAQTGRDHFLKYNRKSGAIESILGKLAQRDANPGRRIIKFQVSQDAKIALVETAPIELADDDSSQADEVKEFQIWNLETQTLVKRLQYGKQAQSLQQIDVLPTVALSPDGKYVVAGKVGFVVWSTQPGDDRPLFSKMGSQRGALWPRPPINNIVFLENGKEFAVSWPETASSTDLKGQANERVTGRIHVYQKQDTQIELVGRFRTHLTPGGFDTNRRAYEPNTFGARILAGKRQILVRVSGGINLIELQPGTPDPAFSSQEWDASETIAEFPGAKFASFSLQNSDILLLNKNVEALVQKYKLETGTLETLDLNGSLSQSFGGKRFANLDWVAENADGSITVQSLHLNQVNQALRDYNTVTLNPDLSVAGLRVLSRPTVEYTAIVGDQAITLESGAVRYWKLVPNPNQQPTSPWLVQPDGILEGEFDLCRMAPNQSLLFVKPRGSSRVSAIDPVSRAVRYEFDADLKGRVTAVEWTDDSSQVAIGDDQGAIQIFSVAVDGVQPAPAQPRSGNKPVTRLAFSGDASALLAIFADDRLARVYRQTDDGWNSVVIGYADDQKDIVAGDISADGRRVVTGASDGHLTIWNTERVGELTNDPEELQDDLEQLEQRELFDLTDGHTSRIRFVRFFKNPNNHDRIDILSASGQNANELTIWKTNSDVNRSFLPLP